MRHCFSIGVFINASKDFEKLDLSFIGLRILKLESKEFRQWLLETQPDDPPNAHESWKDRNHKMIIEQKDSRGGNPWMYVVLPTNIMASNRTYSYTSLEAVLLIMFPCDFRLKAEVFFDQEKTEDGSFKADLSYLSSYDLNFHSDFLTRQEKDQYSLLRFDEIKLKEINSFLKLAYPKYGDSLHYLHMSITAYIAGFKQNWVSMAFVSFVISLEAILIREHKEIGKRLRQYLSKINGETPTQKSRLKKNITLLYELRSNIVHGDHHVGSFHALFQLQALVSRTLIELIALNFKDKKKLQAFVKQDLPKPKAYIKPQFNETSIEMIYEKITTPDDNYIIKPKS